REAGKSSLSQSFQNIEGGETAARLSLGWALQRGTACQRWDGLSSLGVRDERGKTPLLGLFFLGADDPPESGSAIPGGLRLEEVPGCLVGPELSLACIIELEVVLIFIGVDARPLARARFECLEAIGVHPTQRNKLLGALDIDAAPGALWPAR